MVERELEPKVWVAVPQDYIAEQEQDCCFSYLSPVRVELFCPLPAS